MPEHKIGKEKNTDVVVATTKVKSKLGLTAPVGKTVPKMTKAEQEALLIAIGQQLGLLDEKGTVKPL